MSSIDQILMAHTARYPRMQVQDAIKLIYQNTFGSEHFACDEDRSLSRLYDEVALLPKHQDKLPLFENIGNGVYRLNLAELGRSGLSLSTVNRMFLAGTETAGSERSFQQKLAVLLSLSEQGLLAYNKDDVETAIHAYLSAGIRPISHSDVYKYAYSPAYRLVDERFRKYVKIFIRIDQLLKECRSVNTAIDGMCCAGKSTLASLLSAIYDCNVFHMDDFFLPAKLRTKERLSVPGGNIHFERFDEQIIRRLDSPDDFEYQKYDCRTTRLSVPFQVSSKRLNIIEGVYCLRPEWIPAYDLKIFLSTSAERQRRRVQRRCGDTPLSNRFFEEWIPMENRYFEAFMVRDSCDLKYFN